MRRAPRPASARGLRTAALGVVPVLVVLAVPASATTAVAVTAAASGCGVVVTVTGLEEGTHTAVVRATVPGTGDPVPVVPDEQPDAEPEASATSTAASTATSTAAAPEPAGSATPEPSGSPTPEPVLTAERTLHGDGDVVVVLDATAVPDVDPRVVVEVTVDGEAAAPVELLLPACGAPATDTPPTDTPATDTPATDTPATDTPSTETPPTDGPPTDVPPTDVPAATPTSPPSEPTAPLDEAGAEPTTSPVPSGTPAAPSPAPSTTAAPVVSTVSTTAPRPGSRATVPSSEVVRGGPVPVHTPTLEQAYGAYGRYELGTGSTGYLSLMSFAAAPQLEVAPEPEPVPAPVIAAPEGSAAGLVAAPDPRSPLEDLLPPTPDRDDDTVPAQLAAPELATVTTADPLVDLAPAAFVLSASLGGLLMAGRRRTP